MKEQINYNGEKIDLDWQEVKDFSNLDNITQVYVLIFNELGEILIVSHGKDWRLPGGKPENNESLIEALTREVDEEVDAEITDILPIGYVKITPSDKKKRAFYQLRYIAKLKKLKPQTIDPAENKINRRLFIKPENFLDYVHWGSIGKRIVSVALEEKNAKK